MSEDGSNGLPAEPWAYTAGKGRGLPASSAPNWTVRPYIHWGYRDELTAHQALSSLFYCHNETGNVITHLGGLAVFVSLFVRDLFSDTLPPHHRAVSCAYLGVAQYCMGSSAAFHLLGPISKKGYEFALRCDMTGIALVIISSFLIGIHYGYWCHERTGHIYLAIVGILSCIAISWPFIPVLFRNFNASVAFFASFVAFALVPLFHWCILVGGPTSEQANLFLYKLLATFGSYGLGFVFYASQFPERRWPGRFGFWGHSHQLWHVFVFIGALLFYVAVKTYAEFRVRNGSCVGHQ